MDILNRAKLLSGDIRETSKSMLIKDAEVLREISIGCP
jgi:hypothetical protein